MIPTGSRLLLAATFVATVTAIIYASTVWGSLGTTGLIFVAGALALLAGLNLAVRDSNVRAPRDGDEVSLATAAAHAAPSPSVWPIIGSLGAVLVVVGLATYPVVFTFGIIAIGAAAIEWMVQAWSERASADGGFNTEVRERIANPAEFPLLAALVAAVVIYSFSRIMLFLSKTGGPIAFGVVAAAVLVAGFVIASRRQVKSTAVGGVVAIAVLGLVAGGVAAAMAGERELHPHETTGLLATDGDCDTDDETHADNLASQTIGAKANIFGEIILTEDGELVATAEGVLGESNTITIMRANPTNIAFRNNSGEDRRLVLDLGPAATGDAAAPEDLTEEGETGGSEDAADSDDGGRSQICTALVGDGGAQLLTFEIGPRTPDEEITFFVPGVDGQTVEVVVP